MWAFGLVRRRALVQPVVCRSPDAPTLPVSYDPARDWFAVTDTQNARVQIVRLPGSGGSGLSAVSRALAGPLSACLIPLMLILLAIVAGIIYRILRRRKKKKSAPFSHVTAADREQRSCILDSSHANNSATIR